MVAVALDGLPTVTPPFDDTKDNVRSNCSLPSTTLSHVKLINAAAWLLPGEKEAMTCLEEKSTSPPAILLNQ